VEKILVVRWIAWNTLGWSAAIGTAAILQGPWGWIACGAIVGTAQWLALHGRMQLSPAWIAGTCAAWTVGIWAGLAHAFLVMDPFWAGTVGGALAGLAQLCILWRRFSWAALWMPSTIVTSTLGWVAGTYAGLWAVDGFSVLAAYFSGGAVGGAVMGAASAPLLLAMFRHPKPQPGAAPAPPIERSLGGSCI
jgi:hypothetical protein